MGGLSAHLYCWSGEVQFPGWAAVFGVEPRSGWLKPEMKDPVREASSGGPVKGRRPLPYLHSHLPHTKDHSNHHH